MSEKIMPPEPTRAMLDAAEAALTNPTVKNPKAAAWDALVAYRAMWRVAPTRALNADTKEPKS